MVKLGGVGGILISSSFPAIAALMSSTLLSSLLLVLGDCGSSMSSSSSSSVIKLARASVRRLRASRTAWSSDIVLRGESDIIRVKAVAIVVKAGCYYYYIFDVAAACMQPSCEIVNKCR